MNDVREFGRTNAGVFPKDCELRLQHQGTHASILNLNFNTVGGKSVYKLYDKRDSFRFFIVMMSNIDSNTPNNIFYSTLYVETPRIACSNLHFSDFLPSISLLIGIKNTVLYRLVLIVHICNKSALICNNTALFFDNKFSPNL